MAKSKDVVRQIKKATRRKFSADEKIRIVMEGLRGEQSISDICRREGIAASVYYKWSKAFLGAGKNGLTRDTLRDAEGRIIGIRRRFMNGRKVSVIVFSLPLYFTQKPHTGSTKP